MAGVSGQRTIFGILFRFVFNSMFASKGAFLIPFILFSFLLGVPMVFLELSVGQYTSLGSLSCWTMAKCFRGRESVEIRTSFKVFWQRLFALQGVGIAINFSNSYVCIYYNMLIAYSIYYLFKSLASTLPWKYCDQSWASKSEFIRKSETIRI